MKHRLLLSAALVTVLALPAQAQLFGPSDAEVAAQKAHEDGQDSRIQQNADDLGHLQTQTQGQLRDLQDKVRSLTDSLARATGANEELAHQIALLNDKIAQQQRDFDYRLCTISAQQLGADSQSLNCAAAGSGAAARPSAPLALAPGARLAPMGADAPSDSGPALRGRAPGVLGTLPADSGGRIASSGPVVPAGPPQAGGGGDSRQYDTAMNLLARAQYVEASAAFRGYADSHPDDDDLSPQALYWVGHLAAMQRDYATASRVFAEQIKKYPKSPRSPDSMLEIGQSLLAQGQKSGGCTALGAIRRQYPNAAASTLTSAANARKAAGCG